MNTFRICASGILVICLIMGGSALGSELDISGFVDVISTYQSSQNDQNEFGLGQAEVDIENELSERSSIAVAIAYNNEDAVFELGEAEIGLNVWKSENSFFSSVDVTAGQFDVPFGIDYNVYPSIDRKLVTSPLAVDLTHDGWNDFGVRLNATSPLWNLVVFGVNGFESSCMVSDAAQSLSLGVDVGDEVNTTPANAFGGRVGITPVPNFEFGGSFAVGINESNENEMAMYGGDVQWSMNQFDFKGEYIAHSLNRSIEQEDNAGYYFQGIYNFDRTFLVGRYDSFQPDGADWCNRYSVGAGYSVVENIEVRFETQIDNENSDNNQNYLQLVAGF